MKRIMTTYGVKAREKIVLTFLVSFDTWKFSGQNHNFNGTYEKDGMNKFTTMNQSHSKCVCFNGSLVNGTGCSFLKFRIRQKNSTKRHQKTKKETVEKI